MTSVKELQTTFFPRLMPKIRHPKEILECYQNMEYYHTITNILGNYTMTTTLKHLDYHHGIQPCYYPLTKKISTFLVSIQTPKSIHQTLPECPSHPFKLTRSGCISCFCFNIIHDDLHWKLTELPQESRHKLVLNS